MPFYNMSRIVRTLIFNGKNVTGGNLGILIGWILLSMVNVTGATWLFRRKEINAYKASLAGSVEKGVAALSK